MSTLRSQLLLFVHLIYFTSSYFYGNRVMTWDDAEAYCQTECDSHLASIRSYQDLIDIKTLLTPWQEFGTFDLWIGLKLNASTWTDQTSFTFHAPWYPSNPSGDGQCIEIIFDVLSPNGAYNDYGCTNYNSFICNECVNYTIDYPTYTTFYLSPNQFSFVNAQAYCKDHCHSELASIHSDEQHNAAVYLGMDGPTLDTSDISDSKNSQNVWIGLHKKDSKSVFKWLDTTPWDYAHVEALDSTFPWGCDEPDLREVDRCVALRVQGDCAAYAWSDTSCDSSDRNNRFLCGSCDGELNKYAMIHSTPMSYADAEHYCNSYLSTSLASLHSYDDYNAAAYLCLLVNNGQEDSGNYDCYVGLNRYGHQCLKYDYDQQLWTEASSCTDTQFFLCDIPSLLCDETDWMSWSGQHVWNGCDVTSNGSDSIMSSSKQYVNENNTLVIEYVFKVMEVYNGSGITDSSVGIMIFNNTSNRVCDYTYFAIDMISNALTITRSVDGEEEVSPKMWWGKPFNMSEYHTIKVSVSRGWTWLTTDEGGISTQNDIVSIVRSGYIGIRNTNSKIQSKSLYISGGLFISQMNHDDILQQSTSCTGYPTAHPTQYPSDNPSLNPTNIPTWGPSLNPTMNPTSNPSSNPTSNPSSNPTLNPTLNPTSNPTLYPTLNPTLNVSIYLWIPPVTMFSTSETDHLEQVEVHDVRPMQALKLEEVIIFIVLSTLCAIVIALVMCLRHLHKEENAATSVPAPLQHVMSLSSQITQPNVKPIAKLELTENTGKQDQKCMECGEPYTNGASELNFMCRTCMNKENHDQIEESSSFSLSLPKEEGDNVETTRGAIVKLPEAKTKGEWM